MAHGAGGRQTSELIDEVFKAHFANPDLTADDAAVLVPPAGKMAVSTDGFIVSPAFFPGGNIGKLSICGTVNDLACMGAKSDVSYLRFCHRGGFSHGEAGGDRRRHGKNQQKKPECVSFPEILRWQEKARLTVCLSQQPEWVRSRKAFR